MIIKSGNFRTKSMANLLKLSPTEESFYSLLFTQVMRIINVNDKFQIHFTHLHPSTQGGTRKFNDWSWRCRWCVAPIRIGGQHTASSESERRPRLPFTCHSDSLASSFFQIWELSDSDNSGELSQQVNFYARMCAWLPTRVCVRAHVKTRILVKICL